MLYLSLSRCSGIFLLALAPFLAHTAPGEDPVTISGRVSYLQIPTPPMARSGNVEFRKDMPDNMAAKISRYTAKAFSPNVGDIKTEKDVVQAVRTNGTQTTCYQSIGSVSGPSPSANTGSKEQIVVLRGDVINICN